MYFIIMITYHILNLFGGRKYLDLQKQKGTKVNQCLPFVCNSSFITMKLTTIFHSFHIHLLSTSLVHQQYCLRSATRCWYLDFVRVFGPTYSIFCVSLIQLLSQKRDTQLLTNNKPATQGKNYASSVLQTELPIWQTKPHILNIILFTRLNDAAGFLSQMIHPLFKAGITTLTIKF